MSYNNVEILLVEDNIDDAEFALSSLNANETKSKIFHVKDGAEALDFIYAEGKYSERQKDKILKLIILDLKIPKVSGLEVLRRVKSNSLTKSIPVIILTSSKEERDIEEAYKLGANSYIVKPIEFDILNNTIIKLGEYWLQINQPGCE
ncbi:MAG: response regulator [Bacteroidetes bacterium]|nr:response regulator [Bacteroidota bacterium]